MTKPCRNCSNSHNSIFLSIAVKKSLYANKIISISDEEFRQMREMIHLRFGINLTENKRPLLVNRLQKILKKNRISSFGDYYQFIQSDKDGSRSNEMIDAVSTNHTFFFREKNHFDFLTKNILPELTRNITSTGDTDIRIWCAAASTGEEPYGLAIFLKAWQLYISTGKPVIWIAKVNL